MNENIAVLDEGELLALSLSEQGQLARDILLQDLQALKAHGASPTLNVIKYDERDDSYPFFSTGVYSFHVDRSLYRPILFYARTMAHPVKSYRMHKPYKK